MRICPACHTELAEGLRFCPKDGTDLSIDHASGNSFRQTTPLKPQPHVEEQPAAQEDEDDEDELVGTVVDNRYRVLACIGRGGIGAVYRAEHVPLRRIVALKVLHRLYADNAEFTRRFEREARAASEAIHPSCVSVLDCGSFAGRPYLVMEYVEGRLLSEYLADRSLPLREAAELGLQILTALSHAHRHGIVHRDIKPDNIMLCQPEQAGTRVKLLDFGLAKNLVSGAPGSDSITHFGTVFGTPSYISPEQAIGAVADMRSDLYSLGVVLFQMVCGRKPFLYDDPVELIQAHIRTAPPRARELRAELSSAFDTLIARALEKDRGKRFQTAEEFMTALKQVPELGAASEAGPAALAEARSATRGARGLALVGTVMHRLRDALAFERVWPRSRRTQLVAAGVIAAVLAVGGALLVGRLAPDPPTSAAGLTAARPPIVRKHPPGSRQARRRSVARTPRRVTSPLHATSPVPAVGVAAASAPSVTAGGGAYAPPAREPQAPPPPEGAQPALSRDVRRALGLLDRGRADAALQTAKRAAKRDRRDPYAHLVLGHAYYAKLWLNDALKEYAHAIHYKPELRDDPTIIQHAITCLHRSDVGSRALSFLVQTIGAPARPALAAAASSHSNPVVRRRAAQALERLR